MSYTILIVDDSAITRKLINRALPLSGMTIDKVHEAESGKHALAILRAEPIGLVLTDLNMPEMGGAALIEAMNDDESLRQIPVIVISTEGSKPRLHEIEKPQVAGYLRKPFTPEQLKSTLSHLWRRYEYTNQ